MPTVPAGFRRTYYRVNAKAAADIAAKLTEPVTNRRFFGPDS
jgi:hypothetical protein